MYLLYGHHRVTVIVTVSLTLRPINMPLVNEELSSHLLFIPFLHLLLFECNGIVQAYSTRPAPLLKSHWQDSQQSLHQNQNSWTMCRHNRPVAANISSRLRLLSSPQRESRYCYATKEVKEPVDPLNLNFVGCNGPRCTVKEGRELAGWLVLPANTNNVVSLQKFKNWHVAIFKVIIDLISIRAYVIYPIAFLI